MPVSKPDPTAPEQAAAPRAPRRRLARPPAAPERKPNSALGRGLVQEVGGPHAW